jgi:hypothetical protein
MASSIASCCFMQDHVAKYHFTCVKDLGEYFWQRDSSRELRFSQDQSGSKRFHSSRVDDIIVDFPSIISLGCGRHYNPKPTWGIWAPVGLSLIVGTLIVIVVRLIFVDVICCSSWNRLGFYTAFPRSRGHAL